ncbi:TPA: substrate-binding periplasmic protein [Vibrio vulnificus]
MRYILLPFLMALPCHLLADQNNKVVKFAIGDWEPYTSSIPQQELKISETLVRRAFELRGYTIELEYFPWVRSYQYAIEGRFDASFPWMKNEERIKHFYYSNPIFSQRIQFFYHKDSEFSWQLLTDLDAYRLGATQGYQATFFLQKHGVDIEVNNAEEDNFVKIAKGRLDAYATGVERGWYILENYVPEELREYIRLDPKHLLKEEMYVIFSKFDEQRSKQLLQEFNAGLQQLIDSGEYADIMKSEAAFLDRIQKSEP